MTNKLTNSYSDHELHFILDIEDGWPPVSLEGVQSHLADKGYVIDSPPLFVKNMSVGDVIAISKDEAGNVLTWKHVTKSSRSTIWLLRLSDNNSLETVKHELLSLGCFVVQLPEYGVYSIDVPADCSIKEIDEKLSFLDQGQVAVAYPSFRHQE